MTDGADWKYLLSQPRPRLGNPHVYWKSPPSAVIHRAGERMGHATRCITISVSLSRGSNPDIQRFCCGIQINDSYEFPLQLHECCNPYSLHRPSHSNHSPSTYRSWPHTLLHVHGDCCNHGGRPQIRCSRSQYAGHFTSVLAIAYHCLLAIIPVLHIWNCRHVYLTMWDFLIFFYSEPPRGLKTVPTCFLWSSMALGYYLSTVLVQIVNCATKHITNCEGMLKILNTVNNCKTCEIIWVEVLNGIIG